MSRESLLSYRSGWGAWIGKGATKLSWSTVGEIRIDDGTLTLVGSVGVLASCPVEDASAHAVPVWFGPQWSNLRTGRRATRVFRHALAQAQRR